MNVKTGIRSGTDIEPFIGEVAYLPYNYLPRGWAPCDGQLLPIAENVELFSLIGSRFGGNARTTFAVPNLPDKQVNGAVLRPNIAMSGIYPPRS